MTSTTHPAPGPHRPVFLAPPARIRLDPRALKARRYALPATITGIIVGLVTAALGFGVLFLVQLSEPSDHTGMLGLFPLVLGLVTGAVVGLVLGERDRRRSRRFDT